MKIGIVALQGAVSEHLAAVTHSLKENNIIGSALPVRKVAEAEAVDALILPGGESTTISKLLVRSGIFSVIIRRAEEGMPIMGTCAGTVLLATEGDNEVDKTETSLLGLMDMAVDRNAFGRQKESFESQLNIEGVTGEVSNGEGPADGKLIGGKFTGVFIRAPIITRTWGRCKPISKLEDGKIVMAKQDAMLALSFHPELTNDHRIHKMLIDLV